MKLTMLGTGNAVVTECYNTCFVLEERNDMKKKVYFAGSIRGGRVRPSCRAAGCARG